MVLLLLGVLVVFTGVGALPYIDPQADRLIPEQEVHRNCQYNGHLYSEGEGVITEEPCLNCTCTRGSLVCYLKVCPELPNPPPRNCILAHRKNRCCAQLVCQFHQKLRHENQENELLEFVAVNQKGCYINGTTYAEGSAMASSNLCDYCYCIKGEQMCVQPQCVMKLEGCKPYYNTTLTCCPTRYDCDQAVSPVSSTASLSTADCQVDNKVYAEGEMVKEIAKSHCENCFCMKGKIHCVSLSCKPPAKNCIPVIKSGECCPTKYNCSDISESKSTYPNKSKINLIQSNKLIEEQNAAEVVINEGRSHRVMNKLQKNITENNKKYHNENDIKSTMETESTTTELTITTTVTAHTETTTIPTESTTMTTMQTSADTSPFTTSATDTTVTALTTGSTTSISTTEQTVIRKEELVASIYNITAGNISEIKNTTESEKSEIKHVSDVDLTTMIMPLRREDYDNILEDELKLNEAMTMETDTTHFTAMPTTLIIPEDMFVTDITLHSNVSIAERDSNILSTDDSLPPLRTIPPEIEALINITQSGEDDYEDYDYDDPSLPPSLPNLKIIPFVAADAVLENEDNRKSTLYPLQERRHTTDNSPVYNRFSPPVKTEGGFRPRDPVIDGPFYESKIDIPYTTGLNIPAGHLPVDATVGTVPLPAVTLLSRTDETLTSERCFTGEHEYMHGDLVSEPGACLVCVCHHGEVFCQDTKCPPLKPGCRRLRAKSNSCCGRIICDDTEFPTVVLDRIEPPLHSSALSGNFIPPVTVAEGLVTTPDPFRDVIRTEPAPDLPALIGDLKPYLERRSTTIRPQTTVSSSTTTTTTASTTTSTTASTAASTSASTTTSTTVSTTELITSSTSVPSKMKYSIVTPTILLTTTENTKLKEDEIESKIMTKPVNNISIPEAISEVEEEDDDSTSLFDSVFQFFFPGDSTTTSRTTTVSANNLTSSFNYENNDNKENFIFSSDNNQLSINDFDTWLNSTFDGNSTIMSETQTEANITTTTITTNNNNSVTEKYEPISSSREPPPGRPPNIDVSADPGAASGILKLAGCNIYGRMYRVGRIISELSTPCLECMCTEVGVQCRPLEC